MTDDAWKYVAFDLEADGFKPSVIFCICITDLLSMESRSYSGDDIPEALILLAEAVMVVGHYIRGYDCPVIERLTDGMITFTEEAKVDTLDMSKKLTSRQKHSLEIWGGDFGLPKLPSPLFERFDPKMIPYCERDVAITVKVFFHLLELYLESDCKKTFRNHEALAGFLEKL
jgi:DNA polymerase III epsilon subunit-like protein